MSLAELPPETEAIVLAVLEARVKAAKAAARAPLEPLYADGDKRVIRSPLDDQKLGTVYRSDPPPVWEVVDEAATAAWLGDDPVNVEYVDEIVSVPAAIEVLREHAPGLLARVERVSRAAFQRAVVAAKNGVAVPGVERRKPPGTLSVRPDKAAAGPAIEALIAARWITYDGRPLELPAVVEAEVVDPEPEPVNLRCPACAGRFDGKATRVRDGRTWHTSCASTADVQDATMTEQDAEVPA